MSDEQRQDLEERPEEPLNDADGGEDERFDQEDRVIQMQKTLQQRTTELEEMRERYVRTAADFDNFRKRKQREIEDFRKYANEQLAVELLTVVDHLGLALKHAGEAGETVQGVQQGVELVYKQLLDVLEKAGIKRFASEGQPFDPVRHDAMMQVEDAGAPENTVVQVLQDGYLYFDKVLRHAKVGVSKKPAVAADVQSVPQGDGQGEPPAPDQEQD